MNGKVYCYLRWSGHAQSDGDSYARQQSAVIACSKDYGVIDEWFVDAGVSGTLDLADRPSLFKLRAKVKSGDVVLVESSSRLARDLMVSETIMRDFHKAGVRIVSATEPSQESKDPTTHASQTLIRQIFAGLAQYERALIVAKLRAARDRKRATGQCEGNKRYGLLEGESGIVPLVLRLRSEGHSLRAIGNALTAAGHKPRSGRKWQESSILAIYRRESKRAA